jgi:hypothetical protein
MSNKIEELINSCEELVILLQKNGNDNWAQWFNAALASLRQDDLYGCRKILNAYGGMGSFNDFGLSNYKEEVKKSLQRHVPRGKQRHGVDCWYYILFFLLEFQLKYLVIKLIKKKNLYDSLELKEELINNLWETYIKKEIIQEDYLGCLISQWIAKIKV